MPSERILQQKKEEVEKLSGKLAKAQAFVLADYRGLTVEQDTKMRRAMREAGVDYRVYKNSIVRFAVKDTQYSELEKYLEGPTAIAISDTDPVTPSKLIAQFAKDYEKLEIKAGMVEGKILDIDGVKELAQTPSREELLARLIGSLQSSLYGLAIALNAIVEKQEQAQEA
ncbi:MAG: 50S ribosomal protein L10 [Clostridiaceae bacterium]|jgi:large subunit ribosomal protein L10|nr:50S ribosomal protein L10 [Clostridiaceae bacterium]